MIRKSAINLKFANICKFEKIKEIAEEYQKADFFIDILWEQKQFSGNFVKDTPAGRQAGRLTANQSGCG